MESRIFTVKKAKDYSVQSGMKMGSNEDSDSSSVILEGGIVPIFLVTLSLEVLSLLVFLMEMKGFIRRESLKTRFTLCCTRATRGSMMMFACK
jgi:hypothetical protein